MQDSPSPQTPRKNSRYVLPVGALAFAALGWTAFWFFAANRVETTLDDWTAREASHGRIWTCPQRRTAGYPFRIEVSCAAPTFSGPAGKSDVKGSVGRLSAFAQIYQPNLVLADIDGPLVVYSGDGGKLEMAWSRLRLSLRSRPQTLERLSLQGADGKLTTSFNGAEIAQISAAEFEAHVRQTPERQDNAYDLALNLRRAALPAFDKLTGMPDPADLDFSGTSNHLVFAKTGNFPERLEIWRAAGGKLDPASLEIRKGPTRLRIEGRLGLDAAHRPEGRLNIDGDGLQPLLKRFGLEMVAAGNLLDGLLGGKPRKDGETTKPALKATITLERGRVALGPVPLPVILPPLY